MIPNGKKNGGKVGKPERTPPNLFREGLPLPSFSTFSLTQDIVLRATQSMISFQRSLEHVNDQERRKTLYTFFGTLRERLLRLLVIIKFARQQPTQGFKGVDQVINDVLVKFNHLSEVLYNQTQNLHRMKEPEIDINSAVEVISTGSFGRLLPNVLTQRKNEVNKVAFLEELNDRICLKILKEKIPQNMLFKVEEGKVTLTKFQEYEIVLSIQTTPLEPQLRWKIVHAELLPNMFGHSGNPLSKMATGELIEMLEKTLRKDYETNGDSGESFSLMDQKLHKLALRAVMDMLLIQAKEFCKGQMPVKFQSGYDASKDEMSVRIMYWNIPPERKKAVNQPKRFYGGIGNHYGMLSIMINHGGRIQFDHLPVIPECGQPKFDNTSVDISRVVSFFVTNHCAKRLQILRDIILENCYWFIAPEAVSNVSFNEEKSFPFLVVHSLEDYQVQFHVEWRTGKWRIDLLHGGVPLDGEMKNRRGVFFEEVAKIQQMMNESFVGIEDPKGIVHVMKTLMSNCILLAYYNTALETLGLSSHDFLYWEMFKSRMGEAEGNFLKENKCVYIRYPDLMKAETKKVWDANMEKTVSIPVSRFRAFFAIYVQQWDKKEKRVCLKTKTILILEQHHRYSMIPIEEDMFVAPQLSPEGESVWSRKRKREDEDENEEEEEEEEGAEKSVVVKKRKVFHEHKTNMRGRSSLTHLKFLLENCKFLVMRNSLFQQLVTKVRTFKYDPPTNNNLSARTGRIRFMYSLNEMNVYVFFTVEKTCNLKLEVVLHELDVSGIDLTLNENVKIEVVQKQGQGQGQGEEEPSTMRRLPDLRIRMNYSEKDVLNTFLKDFDVIDKMIQLCLKVRAIGADSNYPPNVKISKLSLNGILIEYGAEYEYKCSINWIVKTRYSVQLNFKSVLHPFIERFLNNEKNMKKFLVVLALPSRILNDFERSFRQDRYYWTIIPRNLAVIRLVFKGRYSFWLFMKKSVVSVVRCDKGLPRKFLSNDQQPLFNVKSEVGKESEIWNALKTYVSTI